MSLIGIVDMKVNKLRFGHWASSCMVCGDVPFSNEQEILDGYIRFRARLTDKCQNIIRQCLKVQPIDRPTLGDLLNHPWMSAN